MVVAVRVEDGVRLADLPPARRVDHERCPESDLGRSLCLRGRISGGTEPERAGTERALVDGFAAKVLAAPRSDQWAQSVSTALLGSWADPLVFTGRLSDTAIGALRTDAPSLHKNLTPLRRRGTKHGQVLSLDASMGEGLSLYDLVAVDIDLLARTPGGVSGDERLNRVLRALEPDEQQVVFAYVENGGTTGWRPFRPARPTRWGSASGFGARSSGWPPSKPAVPPCEGRPVDLTARGGDAGVHGCVTPEAVK